MAEVSAPQKALPREPQPQAPPRPPQTPHSTPPALKARETAPEPTPHERPVKKLIPKSCMSSVTVLFPSSHAKLRVDGDLMEGKNIKREIEFGPFEDCSEKVPYKFEASWSEGVRGDIPIKKTYEVMVTPGRHCKITFTRSRIINRCK